MTSSDVLDYVARDPAPRRRRPAPRACDKLLAALAKRAREHAKTPMIGRSHGIFAEPITFGLALAGHHAEIARGRDAARAARARRSPSARSPARSGRTRTCRRPSRRGRSAALGLTPETVAHAGRRARPARGLLRGAGARRGGHRAARDQRAPLAAERGGRGRGGVHRGPEGVERDAAQAKPHPEREPLRPGARRPRRGGAGARGRGALARARHLALVGRAHDRARRDGDARVHARARRGARRGARRLPGEPPAKPRARRRSSTSARRCCSRSSRPGCRGRRRTCSCSATRCARGGERGRSASYLAADAEVMARLGAGEAAKRCSTSSTRSRTCRRSSSAR